MKYQYLLKLFVITLKTFWVGNSTNIKTITFSIWVFFPHHIQESQSSTKRGGKDNSRSSLTFTRFTNTPSKVSVFGVIVVRIFPNLDWIRRDTKYFPKFGLHTERYGVSLGIQSKYGKIRTRITPNTAHFHAMEHLDISRAITAEIFPLNIASDRNRTGNPCWCYRKESCWCSYRKELTIRNLSILFSGMQLQFHFWYWIFFPTD